MTRAEIESRLTHVKRLNGKSSMARCRAHEDTNASLQISDGRDGSTLLHCHAGCDTENVLAAIGLTFKDLFPVDFSSSAATNATMPPRGLTVEKYAEFKGLSVENLKKWTVATTVRTGGKVSVVAMPYKNTEGKTTAIQYRHALTGEKKFSWRKGDKPTLYGLWRLKEFSGDSVAAVEGASDCHTLWSHNVPALGLPGVNTWKEEFAALFSSFEKVYLVVEPDNGGQTLLKTFGKSRLREKVFIVTLNGHKDVSELHLASPEEFQEKWQAAIESAPSYDSFEAQRLATERKNSIQQCRELATSEDILSNVEKALSALGITGEEKLVKVVYLALTSRFFERPVSLAVKGLSSSGKSITVEQTLKLFPASAYLTLSAMSEKFLAYVEESFEHRYVVLYEAPGLGADMSNYLIRSLLSEGHIKYGTVEKEGGLHGVIHERPGPTGLILTTTEVSLHPENETRVLSLEADDSPEQNRRVMEKLAEMETSGRTAVDFSVWHALQDWLGAGSHKVVIPYAGCLAKHMPAHTTRVRRDFTQLLTLIKAHALLHQYSRETDGDGRIVATVGDYAAVRELVLDTLGEAIEATVPETVKATVEAIGALTPGISSTTYAAVGEYLKLEKSAARRRVQAAIKRGFVKNLESRPGLPAQLQLDANLPVDIPALPLVEVVEGWQGGADGGFGYRTTQGAENKEDKWHGGRVATVSPDKEEEEEAEAIRAEACGEFMDADTGFDTASFS